jgi:hypothetical protein
VIDATALTGEHASAGKTLTGVGKTLAGHRIFEKAISPDVVRRVADASDFGSLGATVVPRRRCYRLRRG